MSRSVNDFRFKIPGLRIKRHRRVNSSYGRATTTSTGFNDPALQGNVSGFRVLRTRRARIARPPYKDLFVIYRDLISRAKPRCVLPQVFKYPAIIGIQVSIADAWKEAQRPNLSTRRLMNFAYSLRRCSRVRQLVTCYDSGAVSGLKGAYAAGNYFVCYNRFAVPIRVFMFGIAKA